MRVAERLNAVLAVLALAGCTVQAEKGADADDTASARATGSPQTATEKIEASPAAADGKGLELPLSANVAGYSLVDRLDVGSKEDETAHQYVIDDPNYEGTHEFRSSNDAKPFRETLRATRFFETFRVKVKPGTDHMLVKAFDTLSKNQRLRVSVDGVDLGEWALPDADSRYGESTLVIPARAIGDRHEVTVRVELVSASIDMNSLMYWVYAKSGEPSAKVAMDAKPSQR